MKLVKYFIACFLSGFCFMACQEIQVYEKTTFFNEHQWKQDLKPSFEFAIEDTTALYHLYVIIRHHDAYLFNNIWLTIGTQQPNEKNFKTQLVNLALADNRKGWLGTGMGDVFDHRVRITARPIPMQKGVYHFWLQQQMRQDPLNHLLSVGLRVEKVDK